MKPFITIAICLLVTSAHAQNLVPNGDFETAAGCPDQFSGLSKLRGWYQVRKHQGTPDHFSLKCTSSGSLNKIGRTQSAYNGDGFVGMFVYGHNAREYVGIQLSRQLEKDTVYQLTFFVQASAAYGKYVSSFGAHFSNREISGSDAFSSMPLALEATIQNPDGEVINNTNRYKKISASYTAKGGERYLTFGNFKSDEDTKTETDESVDFDNIPFGFILLDNVTLMRKSQLSMFTLPTSDPSNLVGEDVIGMNNNVSQHQVSRTSYKAGNVPKAVRIPHRIELRKHAVLKLLKPKRKTHLKLTISVWDRGAIDNDIVDVFHNGELVINHLSARRFKDGIELELTPGKHLIKVVAITRGRVGPNTARVQLKHRGQSHLVYFGEHNPTIQIVEVVVG